MQEEKELLIRDLCGRLPYGFIVHRYSDNCDITFGTNEIDDFAHFLEYSEGKNFKPYLRSMLSMTEDECKELGDKQATVATSISEIIPNAPYYIEVVSPEQIDWLNENHFDYRGLIEKGLAIAAPEDMYKT